MRTLEELNAMVEKNLEEQHGSLEEYKKLIFDLVETNRLISTDSFGEEYTRFLSIKFDHHMTHVTFDWHTNSANHEKHNEDLEMVVKYLYGKDHGETIDNFIDYLVEYAIPHFKDGRRSPDWYCGIVC